MEKGGSEEVIKSTKTKKTDRHEKWTVPVTEGETTSTKVEESVDAREKETVEEEPPTEVRISKRETKTPKKFDDFQSQPKKQDSPPPPPRNADGAPVTSRKDSVEKSEEEALKPSRGGLEMKDIQVNVTQIKSTREQIALAKADIIALRTRQKSPQKNPSEVEPPEVVTKTPKQPEVVTRTPKSARSSKTTLPSTEERSSRKRFTTTLPTPTSGRRSSRKQSLETAAKTPDGDGKRSRNSRKSLESVRRKFTSPRRESRKSVENGLRKSSRSPVKSPTKPRRGGAAADSTPEPEPRTSSTNFVAKKTVRLPSSTFDPEVK